MNVELSRVRVLPGKSSQVDVWMAFLNDHMHGTLLTLVDERMYVETIFRDQVEGVEYLYWYSVQGEGGQAVAKSTSVLDQVHLDYWRECIDPSYPMVDLSTDLVMIHPQVQDRIDELQAESENQ